MCVYYIYTHLVYFNVYTIGYLIYVFMYSNLFQLINSIHTPEKSLSYAARHMYSNSFQLINSIHPPEEILSYAARHITANSASLRKGWKN
jgi:hypothetical protein